MKKIEISNIKIKKYVYFFIGILAILFVIYTIITIKDKICYSNFSKKIVSEAQKNYDTIFSIDKLIINHSAYAVDNSVKGDLSNIQIRQYSDIALYINNKNKTNDYTNENTVKELFIDNIEINPNKEGILLGYKNPKSFGKYKKIKETAEKIDFTILNNNREESDNDYDTPSFYSDCSNPISLGYVNTNVVDGYRSNNENSSVSMNGKILKEADVDLESLYETIKFKLHIINNKNEEFTKDVSVNILSEQYDDIIYEGNVAKELNFDNNQYVLRKH